MKSSAKIVEQIRKALADPESVKYDTLKAIAKEYGEACNRLNLGLTKAVVYYSTGNYSEAARILKEGNLLSEYQTLLFPELEAWREVCQMFGWKYTAYVSTVNGEKLKKFLEEYERKADSGQGAVDGRSNTAVFPLEPVATPSDNSFSGSGAPGREPLPYLPKDDVFFTDSSAAAVEDESRVSNDSFSHPYLPPVHRKSKLVLSFPWIVVGGAVLTFFVFMCWILTGDKESNNPTSISPGTAASKQEPSIGAEPKKEATVDISANSESGRAALPEDVDVRGESARRSAADSVEEQVKLEAENGVVPEVAGSDTDSEERVQGDVNPNVVELEEQWNQLREENDFKQIVLFVASLSREIIGFDDKLSNFEICETFLESYEERNSHSLESVMKLCGGVESAKAWEYAESLSRMFEDFDLELFQKKCEIAIEGMERVKKLYRDAYLYGSSKDRGNSIDEMNAIVSNHLFFQGEKDEFHGGSYRNVERLTDRLKPIEKRIDSFLELSKTEEFDKELKGVKTAVSEFPEMRRTLEQEILTFIVQTVNSENSFSTFTGNLKGRKKVPVKFEDTRHELFVWDHIGEDKTSTFGEGMWAYVNYCAGSQNQWVCGLTFAFNKTDEIDAQDKTVVFIPGSKDGEVFNVNVKGKPVSLGVKMSSKDWRWGNLDFYISDPVSIPAILRSARVSISFASRSDPESASFKSDFCQLLKPIDMTQTVDIESDKFLMNCAFISESDYNKLDKSAKKSPVNRKADSETGNVLCVVACDRKNKIEDKTGLFSLKLDVTDSLEMNSDKASKTDEGTRILLLFSRQTDKDYEGSTVVYRRVYAHGIFNALRRFSSYYEGSWALVDEKALSSDSSDFVIDDTFTKETIDRWQQEFGEGYLLFYLVYPDEDVPRENWILYGKAPYRVFE